MRTSPVIASRSWNSESRRGGQRKLDEEHTGTNKHAAGADSTISCWPSGYQHMSERKQRKHRQQEREREGGSVETVWMTSVLTLHFPLIHHLKQKGHWLWEESRAGQGWARSSDSCLHADNPWHANTAVIYSNNSDSQKGRTYKCNC